MIRSFADKETERIYNGKRSRRLPQDIEERAHRRLTQLDAAVTVDDLRLPPSNRLEALGGDREGQWSIRINDRWRICFRFDVEGAYDMEITDYY